MNPPRHVVLREMTRADLEAGLRLCRQSHWNQVARDWHQFFDLTPGGAAVAVDGDNGVIGSVATMRYHAAHRRPGSESQHPAPTPAVAPAIRGTAVGREGDGARQHDLDDPQRAGGTGASGTHTLAWLAMVLVDPAYRGSGVGTALLRHGLSRAADVTVVGLDATILGRPLYEKLGFLADARMVRLHRPATVEADAEPIGNAGQPSRRDVAADSRPRGQQIEVIRPAGPTDLDGIAELDAVATGLDRRSMLAWLLHGAAEYAWVSQRADGVIQGALLGRHGHHASHLGPVIAASDDIAIALVAACVHEHEATPFFIDVVDDRPGWRAAVEALGFEAQRSFTRMYRGPWRPPGDASRLFAIIGPEFG